jgi:hypothetical protein
MINLKDKKAAFVISALSLTAIVYFAYKILYPTPDEKSLKEPIVVKYDDNIKEDPSIKIQSEGSYPEINYVMADIQDDVTNDSIPENYVMQSNDEYTFDINSITGFLKNV